MFSRLVTAVVHAPCVLALATLLAWASGVARAQDSSTAPILQIFETRWDTVEDRLADAFVAGYGRLWLPPAARADSGGLSVGYDVFDRFDLGRPRNETLYGTERSLKTLIKEAHRAGIAVNTDLILNHNGFSDLSTFDNRGTTTTADDVTFAQGGGYPGFVLSQPVAPYGDFHAPQAVEVDRFTGRLAGLNDINQSTNFQFIRHPVAAGNPLNLPAGTQGIFGRPPANVPDANNARFYPDQGLGGTTVFDPRFGQNVTLYDYNTATPLAGDATPDNALGLMLRNVRWMVQEVGVDGFRLDAARHFPQWALNYFDQATFLAKKEPLLDGSPQHVYSFIETGGDGDIPYLQGFIRKDINNANLTQLGGNRDALDFNLFFSLRGNLQENGLVNDWRNVKNVSIDASDDGLANNGSQGVAFARSHDDGPAHLDNVAQAYLMLRPGNALVYTNGHQFGDNRDFPQDGREDALGGLYGDAMTTLVNLRNTHGRGNYADRTPAADQKELLIYEREKSALVVLNNRGDSGYDQRTVQTAFTPGTPLVELTGNADDPLIDPNGELASVVVVNAAGQVTIRAPRNKSTDTTGPAPVVNDHRSGYLVYGVSAPQGQMRLTGALGQDLTTVLAGSTPTPGQGGPGGPSDTLLNGRTRLADLTVVTSDTFNLRVETNAVTLPGGIRDAHADGDRGQFRIDGGVDANGSGAVDNVTPGSIAYGFEEFTGVNQPGYGSATGAGVYQQTIDATQLAEGRHYLTGRVYRHRDTATGGDGGPAVYADLREVIYVDRLKPVAELVSFDPFASNPGNPNNRDLIVRSSDGTASTMHFFLNEPAATTDAALLARAQGGQGTAGYYDRGEWVFGYSNLPSGNFVVSVVTLEPTGNWNVQRFAGLAADTTRGAGIGDLDWDGVYELSDINGATRSIESLIAANNTQFNPSADANADGRIDTRDLVALGSELVAGGAAQGVLDEYAAALLRRADLDGSGAVTAADLAALYAGLGGASPLLDLNVDGVVNALDARSLVVDLVRTAPGDFNLDGLVSAADYTTWRDAQATGDRLGDADFDGDVDQLDYAAWASAFGFARGAYGGAAAVSVPEPTAAGITLLALLAPWIGRDPRRKAATSY